MAESSKSFNRFEVGFFVILILGILFFGSKSLLGQRNLGGAGDGAAYSAVTNTTKTCTGGASTSTLIQATSTGRMSFTVSQFGSSSVTLCKDIVCTAGSGIVVTSTAPNYEQLDSYIGPYSCVATASSTVGVTYSP